jgi:hypothetical protein
MLKFDWLFAPTKAERELDRRAKIERDRRLEHDSSYGDDHNRATVPTSRQV